MSRTPSPPVIIIGMHRSGTAMISRHLEAFGLFMGARKEINNESVFFLKLNDWLLSQCGGSWMHPLPIRDLLCNQDTLPKSVSYLKDSLKSLRSIEFSGACRFLSCRDIAHISTPWGWKDPRNTFTLPVWREIFPNARIVHIFRHGVDVARSLKVRREYVVRLYWQKYRQHRLIHQIIPKRKGFSDTELCADLSGGLSLWELYMTEAEKICSELSDHSLVIRYEHYLENPVSELERMLKFCELDFRKSRVEEVCRDVNPDRAFAYRNNPEAVAFAERNSAVLDRFGYQSN